MKITQWASSVLHLPPDSRRKVVAPFKPALHCQHPNYSNYTFSNYTSAYSAHFTQNENTLYNTKFSIIQYFKIATYQKLIIITTCIAADLTKKLTDIIGPVVIVWRVKGKIIRSVLCNILCNNCAQCNAHTWTDLTVLWIGFCLTGPISLCFDSFLYMYYCMHA